VLDNTGQPVPPTRLVTPASSDASDALPEGEDKDAGANALAAPVDKSEAKSGKTKKSKTQQ
jgi:hypothetical protein